MYPLLCLFTGVLIAVMVTVNGQLSLVYGVFAATVIIHIVGTIASFLACKVSKTPIRAKEKLPLWMYMGGAIGVCNTLSNAQAYGKISMTSIVALGLLGQTLTSLVIDNFGLMGMPKHPVRKGALAGLLLSLAGIFVMMDSSVGSAVSAVFVAFGGGITIVLSRTVNARLAQHVGPLAGSFINHIVGLPITVVICMVLAPGALRAVIPNFSPVPWIYVGGMMGVCSVMLFNVTVPRVPAFQLTLLGFVGQVFMSIALDLLMDNSYAQVTFIGGLLVAAGVALNMVLEYMMDKKAAGRA